MVLNFETLEHLTYSKNFVVYKKKSDRIKPNVIEDMEADSAGRRANQSTLTSDLEIFYKIGPATALLEKLLSCMFRKCIQECSEWHLVNN